MFVFGNYVTGSRCNDVKFRISVSAWISVCCLAVLALAACAINAQESRPVLDLQTATGTTTFHIGERIPLKLTFTSPDDTQFVVAPWVNSRGGEFDFETFNVSPPTGWSDPLATYFAQNFLRMGHGWQWPPLLKSKPVQISLDLNQWVRFDQPGVYTVNVNSRRVLPVNNSGSTQFSLASNVIELHIIPATPEWQAAALNSILQHLSTGGPELENAAADLRYLATPAAIEEMTSKLREGDAFIATECSYGLLGVPDSMRDLAIASMNKRIEEPDFPISQLLFTTMSLLHVTSGSTAESISAQRRAFDPLLWQTVFSSVPRKKGAARAETLQTLLIFGRYLDTPSLKSQMTQLLSGSFLDLDARSQIDDLRRNWDILCSPEILPALQALAKLPATTDGEFDPARENLKAVAFRRWYELDPAGAQREIFHEIGSDEPPLSSQALAFLPAEPLPQFESLWAQVFVGTSDQGREKVLGSLLVHFGTGAATSQMIAKLNEPPRPNSCTSHSLALAYLVRFSPGEARLLLKRDLTTNEAACDAHLFQYISEHATAPLLNDVAIETLHADPRVVLDALRYLRSYGTKADQKPIWVRYVEWTQQWAGKANILDHPEPGLPATYISLLEGEALGAALIANQGWLADRALLSRVLQTCVGQEMCKHLKDIARSAAPPYRLTLPDTSMPLGLDFTQPYFVAQYAVMSRDLLAAKIAQYPRGTNFVLSSAWARTSDQQKLEAEVRALCKELGMSLKNSKH